jgi:hypothetical protein
MDVKTAIRYLDGAILYKREDGLKSKRPDFSDYCDQEGCSEKATVVIGASRTTAETAARVRFMNLINIEPFAAATRRVEIAPWMMPTVTMSWSSYEKPSG